MHVVNGPSQRKTAGWLKEVAHEQNQRKRLVYGARPAVLVQVTKKSGIIDRVISGFQHLFYTCCYSTEAKRILEEVERADAPEQLESLSEIAPLSSPPTSVVLDVEEEVIFGVTNLKAANARADALFAPYIARRMQHLGTALYNHEFPDFYGTNAQTIIVHGSLNSGAFPELSFA